MLMIIFQVIQQKKSAFKLSDELQIVVNRGGFSLICFTINCCLPHESFSSDVENVGVAGLKWYPADDKVALDITELNFKKGILGKSLSKTSTQYPTN